MLKLISKGLLVLTIITIGFASCNKQEDVNPVTQEVAETPDKGRIINTFVYQGQSYGRAIWKKKYQQVEANSYVIVEDDTAYLFDTEVEANNYEKELNKKSRFGGLKWIVGGAAKKVNPNWAPGVTQDRKLLSNYFQCKVRFWEHHNFRGKWIEYRVRGVIGHTWWGKVKNNTYYNRPAKEWSNRISSVVVDEVVQPKVALTLGAYFGLIKISQPGASHLKLTFYNNRDWTDEGTKSTGYKYKSDVSRVLNATGIGKRFEYKNNNLDFGAWCGGTGAVYNDQLGSFKVQAYDHAGSQGLFCAHAK